MVLSLFAPGTTYYWNFWGFKALFRDDLGFGDAWASVVAIPCAFVYVIVLPIALRWLFFGQRRIHALLALLLVYGSTPLLHATLDTNFNQTSGEAQKWYVLQPDGKIALSDVGGFDPTTGAEKHRLTPEVARVIERRKNGLYPKAIADDPRTMKFFDPVTGDAKVWYAKRADGGYDLFDAEGFDEATRELLQPVSSSIADDIRNRAAAENARARAETEQRARQVEAEAKAAAEQAEANEKENARRELIAIFAPDSYSAGAVIIGAKSRQPHDQASLDATRQIMSQLTRNLRTKGMTVNSLATGVYDTVYFDSIMHGDYGVLAEVGVQQRMRSAIFAVVDARCQPAGSISGVISCSVTADARLVRGDKTTAYADALSETGAGTTQEDAIGQAAQRLIERHPDLLNGT